MVVVVGAGGKEGMKSVEGKDGKKDEKPAQKKVAQCT
jgi:hypothetical protein